jgi:enoyl-CoA hydratase/carnithine racemase
VALVVLVDPTTVDPTTVDPTVVVLPATVVCAPAPFANSPTTNSPTTDAKTAPPATIATTNPATFARGSTEFAFIGADRTLPGWLRRAPSAQNGAVDLQTLITDLADGVLTITLNRPEKLNAFNGTMLREMLAVFDDADASDDVRAIVVTGAGRAFCAGADLSAGGATFNYGKKSTDPAAELERLRDGGGRLALRIYALKKPIIGAVNGPAVGVGVTMTLPMDVRLASTDARFGFVFARRGIMPEACSTWFLPRVVGISRAMEWCATGRVFGADEALAGGLVRSVHAAEDLLTAAQALAREIADNTSAVSVAVTRQAFWRMLGADHPMEAHRIESRAIDALGRSADAREGVASFLEKRPAVFTGSAASDLPDFMPWWSDRPFS